MPIWGKWGIVITHMIPEQMNHQTKQSQPLLQKPHATRLLSASIQE